MQERSISIVVEGAMYVDGRRTERFSRLPIVIGRADDCDVVINRPTVAPRHARLVEVYGELFVMAETRRAIVRRPDGVRITGVTSLDAMGWAMRIGGVQVRVVYEPREGLVSEPPPASSTWRYSLERSPAGTEYWHGVAAGGALDVDDGDIEAVLARLHEPHEALLRAIAPLAGPLVETIETSLGACSPRARPRLGRAMDARYPLLRAIPELAAVLERFDARRS